MRFSNSACCVRRGGGDRDIFLLTVVTEGEGEGSSGNGVRLVAWEL